MVLQNCHEKSCSGLIILQLDSFLWETTSPGTHKPKIVNESQLTSQNVCAQSMSRVSELYRNPALN